MFLAYVLIVFNQHTYILDTDDLSLTAYCQTSFAVVKSLVLAVNQIWSTFVVALLTIVK